MISWMVWIMGVTNVTDPIAIILRMDEGYICPNVVNILGWHDGPKTKLYDVIKLIKLDYARLTYINGNGEAYSQCASQIRMANRESWPSHGGLSTLPYTLGQSNPTEAHRGYIDFETYYYTPTPTVSTADCQIELPVIQQTHPIFRVGKGVAGESYCWVHQSSHQAAYINDIYLLHAVGRVLWKNPDELDSSIVVDPDDRMEGAMGWPLDYDPSRYDLKRRRQ
jgi:hypothetical protein